MNIKWDADKYTSDFSFVYQYGNSVINLIDAPKNTSVLDLGCGNGALTKVLHDKGYMVTGMDASENQIEFARKSYPHINFVQGDATDFTLSAPVDVVFSNAVFHWIDKERQQDMLQCVYNVLKKNGEFVFEFGGHGNNQHIFSTLAAIFSEHGYRFESSYYFPTISEYAALLEDAGFRVVYAILFDRPTELKGHNGLKDWIKMFIKAPFSVVNMEEEREKIIDQVVDALRKDLYTDGKWYADYVRIRMKAIRL